TVTLMDLDGKCVGTPLQHLGYNIRFSYQQMVRNLNPVVSTPLQRDDCLSRLNPRIDVFPQMSMMIAGTHSTIGRDFYVLMDGYDLEAQLASFVIYINPLVNLVWWGGIILIIGTIAATYPKDIVPERIRTGNKTKGQ
ncbi:MAG: cytochrome c-type biogenesis CcmF C-terminal domain-containing protein, partial [Chloroflexota bacterium]